MAKQLKPKRDKAIDSEKKAPKDKTGLKFTVKEPVLDEYGEEVEATRIAINILSEGALTQATGSKNTELTYTFISQLLRSLPSVTTPNEAELNAAMAMMSGYRSTG